VLLQVPLLAPLWNKAIGRENDDGTRCNAFHCLNHGLPLLFPQVFDDVQGNTGIEMTPGQYLLQVSYVP